METPTLDYKSHPKRERKHTEHYSEHRYESLVAEPTTYKQAMVSLDADSWQAAILEDNESIQEAGTCTVYDITDFPPGRQPVGSKWVFKVKHNANGCVE